MSRRTPYLVIALASLITLIFISLIVGRYPLAFEEMWQALLVRSAEQSIAHSIVWEIRGPRTIAAVIVGAALALAGAAFQALFRNPLVSPDILGVSTGAALGGVLAILCGTAYWLVQGLAFGGGLLAVALVYWIASRLRNQEPVLALVLCGVVLSALFGAILSLIKYLADPNNQLPAIIFWLLGSFAALGWRELTIAVPIMLLAVLPLALLRWRINLLMLPDDESLALGSNVRLLRLIVIAAATLLTAVSVALAGIIGWIGLLLPHAARLLVGADFKQLLPFTLLLGASAMLAVDILARLISENEIPPGVLTALVGAPFFIVLLARGKRFHG